MNYLVGAFAAVEGDGKLFPTTMPVDPWCMMLEPEGGRTGVAGP